MSLLLDPRQRAMLEEMGVRVWLPLPPAPAAAFASSAPELIAINPSVARATALKHPQTAVPSLPHAPPHTPPFVQEPGPSIGRPAGVANMDWPALQAAVAGCHACALCKSRKNTVFGVGQTPAAPGQAPRADWLIVGEAPGENEDLQGEPFVGQAGKLLDNMLRAIGLARDRNVYIVNVLKCRPPANRNPEPQEVAQCEPFLLRQIELLRPRIILAMGRFAVQSLLRTTDPIGRLRGRAHTYHSVPVVVSYHPAYLLRTLADKARAWEDLCLALEIME